MIRLIERLLLKTPTNIIYADTPIKLLLPKQTLSPMENSFHRGILPKKRKEIRKILETNTAATATAAYASTASTTDPDIDGYDEVGLIIVA